MQGIVDVNSTYNASKPEVLIDIDNRVLELQVEPAEIERRISALPPWTCAVSGGYLRRYAELVTSANTGAVFRTFSSCD